MSPVTVPRVCEAGDAAVLVEWDARIDEAVNARAIATAAALRAAFQTTGLAGVRDVVATYRSAAIYVDPARVDRAALASAVRDAVAASRTAPDPVGTLVEMPVCYGGAYGPDLDDLAAWASLTPGDVVARHAAVDYRVYMLGFQPGFAYLGSVDPRIAAPRLPTPRVRVPAGSVGIAGSQTGVYPVESPGGWRLVGRTAVPMFDVTREPPATCRPGDRVRFVPVADLPPRVADARPPVNLVSPSQGDGRAVTVLAPGLLLTVQDLGRWGHQGEGVPVCGAMDTFSHRLANVLVGNDPAAATLEATLVGPELRVETAATLCVAGADLGAVLDDRPLPLHTAVACRPGSVLRFAGRTTGARAYIAFDGGVATPRILGSRSIDLRSRLGGVDGRALRAGDVVPLGPRDGPPAPAGRRARAEVPRVTVPTGGARVRAVAGPQDGWAPADLLERFTHAALTIAPASDRMGYRLSGSPFARGDAGGMISDATFPGAVQVPPSGDPILLMADRPTAGGYPQIATVISADLPVAAQLAPGDWIAFDLCSQAEARAALAAQEAALDAVR